MKKYLAIGLIVLTVGCMSRQEKMIDRQIQIEKRLKDLHAEHEKNNVDSPVSDEKDTEINLFMTDETQRLQAEYDSLGAILKKY